MRLKSLCAFAILAGLACSMMSGCNSGTEVSVKDAPAVAAPPPQPVPEDVKKGGGKGSSGNMNRNPGASS